MKHFIPRKLFLTGPVLVFLLAALPARAQSVRDLQNQINNTKSDISSLQHTIQRLGSSNASLQNEVNQLQEKLQTLKSEEAALKKKNQKLQTHLSHVKGSTSGQGSSVLPLGLKPLVDTGGGSSRGKEPSVKKKKTVKHHG